MFCPDCGQQTLDGKRFCVHCGADVSNALPGAAPAPAGSEEDTQDRQVAALLATRYTLSGEKYKGGMATVYIGREKKPDRPVAIKVLSASYRRDAVFIARFRQEASTAANLEHNNIVRIYSFIEESDLCAIVMNHLPGGTLKERIKESGRIGVEVLRRWGCEVCAGLSHAHGQGVIHCDIKPANIMFDRLDQAVLVDFGISRARMEPGLTQAVRGLMSPPYMSPEQSRGETRLDQRSDIYSLGVVLYEMATGVLPFRSEDVLGYAHHHQQALPEPPASRVPDIPQWLNDLILHCLSKAPGARPQDVAAVGEGLRSGVWKGGAVKRPAPVVFDAAKNRESKAPAVSSSDTDISLRRKKERDGTGLRGLGGGRGVWGLVGVLVIIGIGLIVWQVLQWWAAAERAAEIARQAAEMAQQAAARAQAVEDSVRQAAERAAAVEDSVRQAKAAAEEAKRQAKALAAQAAARAQAQAQAAAEEAKRQAKALAAQAAARAAAVEDSVRQAKEVAQAAAVRAVAAGMQFVRIPAGEFDMGGTYDPEQPVHRVRISRTFYMGAYEVTQGQWEAVMGSNSSYFKGSNFPVEQVSWEDCQEFIRRLNASEGGSRYRLPTEAEWEYACRAGTTGDYAGSLDAMGWYDGNSGNQTHPVGQKQPNAWRLYDMHGNVWEWCSDWYGSYPSGAVTDPAGPSSRPPLPAVRPGVVPVGSGRVIRGGGWGSGARSCRSAIRSYHTPGFRDLNLGFRLVRIGQ